MVVTPLPASGAPLRPSTGLPALRRCRGLTLIEMLIATAIGTLLLAGLSSVARQALLSRTQVRDTGEAAYQARFALQRVVAAAKGTAPHTLLPPAANTSGNWFSPAYFCVNGASTLVETTAADTGCTGTQAIAERVSSFSATLPTGTSALDAVSAVVAITLTGPGGGAAITLTERVRLGGGLQ